MENLTIQDYEEIAHKIINGLIKTHTSLNNIHKNIDLLNEIVSAIMKADWKFNGHGSLYGYRKQHVLWAIGRYYETKGKQPITFSINDIPDQPDKPQRINLDQIDCFDHILDGHNLSSIQKEYIYLRYYHDWTYSKIGDKYGVARQAVHQSIKNGLDKIKNG